MQKMIVSKLLPEARLLGKGRFLALSELTYLASDGKPHAWESVSRVRSSGAAVLLATLVPSGRILLIRQFRPPADSYVWEFPAGLIDPGETPEETALRELHEETGYHGKVLSVSGEAFSSPGLSSETLYFVRMEVDETAESAPRPEFDGLESIETFPVPLAEFGKVLSEARKNGDSVDAKVETFALSLEAFR